MKKEIRDRTVANIRKNVTHIRDQLNNEGDLELRIPETGRERSFHARLEARDDFQITIGVDGCCMNYQIYLAPDGRMGLYWDGKKFFLLLEEIGGMRFKNKDIPEFLTDDFFRCRQLEKMESLTTRILNRLSDQQ